MNEQNKPKGTNNNKKKPVVNSMFWFYLLLLAGLVYMWRISAAPQPQKKEWLDVSANMLVSGDVDKLVFVRNSFKGEIYIKSDSLSKYDNLFGGTAPKSGPQFYFLVSENFDPEVELDRKSVV